MLSPLPKVRTGTTSTTFRLPNMMNGESGWDGNTTAHFRSNRQLSGTHPTSSHYPSDDTLCRFNIMRSGTEWVGQLSTTAEQWDVKAHGGTRCYHRPILGIRALLTPLTRTMTSRTGLSSTTSTSLTMYSGRMLMDSAETTMGVLTIRDLTPAAIHG